MYMHFFVLGVCLDDSFIQFLCFFLNVSPASVSVCARKMYVRVYACVLRACTFPKINAAIEV